MDLGWTVSSTASSGIWERGVPIGTVVQGSPCAPGNDVASDCSDKAYVTGNAGGSASQDDIDNGYTILTSPTFDLTNYTSPFVHYDRWFYNVGGTGNPNDSLVVKISNGTQTVTLETVTVATQGNGSWVHVAKNISQFIAPSANMKLIVRCADASPGHLVEGGFDKFFIVDSLLSDVNNLSFKPGNLKCFPNPFSNDLSISWKLNQLQNSSLIISDVTGRAIKQVALTEIEGKIIISDLTSNGIYFVHIQEKDRTSNPIKVIKSN